MGLSGCREVYRMGLSGCREVYRMGLSGCREVYRMGLSGCLALGRSTEWACLAVGRSIEGLLIYSCILVNAGPSLVPSPTWKGGSGSPYIQSWVSVTSYYITKRKVSTWPLVSILQPFSDVIL